MTRAGSWNPPALAVQLEQLDPIEAVEWAQGRLAGGTEPAMLHEAALWAGLRRTRPEGRGPRGSVSDAVVAAASMATAGRRRPDLAPIAAVRHVAYTAGDGPGGFNSQQEGPYHLEWFEGSGADDPVNGFIDAALAGECDLADHHWLTAAQQVPAGAEAALWSAAAAGYHLCEHKAIAPDRIVAWCIDATNGIDPETCTVLLRAAARYAANHLQDFGRAVELRADARALAAKVEPDAGGDPDRIGVVATGLARTEASRLSAVVFASLADGLDPEDLVEAISLVNAARFALTTDQDGVDPSDAMRANTGIHAVRHGMARVDSTEVRYELALCASNGPATWDLDPMSELYAPESDDHGLTDLVEAISTGDSDGASEAATAVRLDDEVSLDEAWNVIWTAALTAPSSHLGAAQHVVVLEDDFRTSEHPCRIWYLAAAARTAARSAGASQTVM